MTGSNHLDFVILSLPHCSLPTVLRTNTRLLSKSAVPYLIWPLHSSPSPACSTLPSPPLTHCGPATWAFCPVHKHAELCPTSGLLHLPVSPPAIPFLGSQISAQMFKYSQGLFPPEVSPIRPCLSYGPAYLLPCVLSPSEIILHSCLLGQKLSDPGHLPVFQSGVFRTWQSV